ncbi:MAG: VRR-NUC domain-containing protein [Roseburia sp.]|nr:VRR-NUC domain-containing protein [Roseburia sp.]
MKGEGVTAGVADMILLHPNIEHHALCIEFKTPKGRQQDSQRRFQRKVEAFGYRYEIVRSFDEFMNLIRDYLSKVRKA